MALHSDTLGWIRRRLASEAVIGARLSGGVTSEVYSLVGSRFVVKQISNTDWLAERPDVVAYEARVLEWLAGTPVPAPRLVAVDGDGSEAGFPTLAMQMIGGGPAGDTAPPSDWTVELASVSAAILELEAPEWVREFARYQPADSAVIPEWAADPAVWSRAIEVVSGPAPAQVRRLIHRDFHPWNVMWDGGIEAVVDWSQTAVGPAQMDAAHCRANLAIGFDAAAADDYLAAWGQATGLAHHPYWDLVTCIDFLPDWRPSARGNERLEGWVGAVLGRLPD